MSSFLRQIQGPNLTSLTVDTTDRRVCHDSDDSFAVSYGMARRHNYQCVHCKLLLHRSIWSCGHSPVGVGHWERASILGLQRIRFVPPRPCGLHDLGATS